MLNHLPISDLKIHKSGTSIQISSDSVQTKLSIEDVVWWKKHTEACVVSVVGKPMASPRPTATSSQRNVPVIFAVELASISCDLVDLDSFQSILSLQYLSITKTSEVLEIGVDCLCITAPSVNTTNATFEHHQWNHSVYIGAALIQCSFKDNVQGILVGVDDCKIEWSDKLADQIRQLLEVISTSESHNEKDDAKKKINLRLQMKRAALISVAKEAVYLALTCDDVEAQIATARSIAVSVEHTRIVVCCAPVQPIGVDLTLLRRVTQYIPPRNLNLDPPWRCWNQTKNDARKNQRAAAWDEHRKDNPFLCFETNVLCLTVENLSPANTSVTCSSSSPIYIVWSPLLHRVIHHMRQVILRTFRRPESGNGSPQKSKKLTQYRVLTTHTVELVLELPRHHRMVWRIPSLTFDASPSSLSAVSPKLVVNMDSMDILTAIDVCITRRPFDAQMDSYRRGFKEFVAPSNKVSS
ncbi:unnamed protein product [Cylicostephanus goldi]|uniref:Uncharacterized protein n=1 Tax=Cylicostephanus goldi TaxID=71465 RepID=A0A3P6S0P8_CYLGO|nr:unnamed protein product [Cylicostephanus goldi]